MARQKVLNSSEAARLPRLQRTQELQNILWCQKPWGRICGWHSLHKLNFRHCSTVHFWWLSLHIVIVKHSSNCCNSNVSTKNEEEMRYTQKSCQLFQFICRGASLLFKNFACCSSPFQNKSSRVWCAPTICMAIYGERKNLVLHSQPAIGIFLILLLN